MRYSIQVRNDYWKRSDLNRTGGFGSMKEAIKEIAIRASEHFPYRVVAENEVEVWYGAQPAREAAKEYLASHMYGDETTTHYFTGGFTSMDHLANLPKPLNIPRPALVKALQVKLDEEVKKREDEQTKLDEARKATLDAIAQFTPEELYEIFRSYFTVDPETLNRNKQDETYVPVKVTQARVETDLERAVRVLNLASDDTVEVRPDSDLYKLL